MTFLRLKLTVVKFSRIHKGLILVRPFLETTNYFSSYSLLLFLPCRVVINNLDPKYGKNKNKM